MNDDWRDYPMALFRSAVRSTLGGFAALYVGMVLGTLPGSIIERSLGYRDRLDYTDFLFMPFAPLVLSAIQGWGLFYAAVVVYLLYRLIHEDTSRGWTVLLVAPLHHTVHAIACAVGGSVLYYDWPSGLLYPYLLYVALLAPALGWRLLQRRRAAAPS